MVALRLELGEDHDGEDHFVLVEAADRCGVREQDARVQDEGAVAGRASRCGHWASEAEMVVVTTTCADGRTEKGPGRGGTRGNKGLTPTIRADGCHAIRHDRAGGGAGMGGSAA